MKRTTCVLLSLALGMFPGCSLFRTSSQTVKVCATDSDADLFADGRPIGKGPTTVKLKRNESHHFMAKVPDGRVGIRQVEPSMSVTAIMDIVGGVVLLFPLLGLLSPGAWDLESSSILIVVPPKSPAQGNRVTGDSNRGKSGQPGR